MEKLDVLLISGTFDYGTSVSGNYIMYRILKEIPNLKFKVIPFFKHTNQIVDKEDFVEFDSLDNLPKHKILFATGDDLSTDQIEYICSNYGSKYMVICMTNWIYSNTNNSYPELNKNDYLGDLIEKRLDFLKKVNGEIICGSTHVTNVHNESRLREIPFHLIPLPFEEIEIDNSTFSKGEQKTILWGTTQPETPRKGKKRFENILNFLYKKIENPNEVEIIIIGPNTKIDTNFKIKKMGIIPNRKELSKVYRDCTVFALTTLADSGPMMAIECLKNNTPLVAFPYSIAYDVVSEGKNGYIVNTDEEFSDKLYDILFNKKYHMDLNFIKNFNSMKSVIEKYEKILKF
jgi:glycosyltransferase involved in cell wall biosynthesis